MLTGRQIEFYRENGYLVIESLVPAGEIARLRQEIGDLCARARGLAASDEVYDLEDSHRPDRPRVRRIKLPHRVSPAVRDLLPQRDDSGAAARPARPRPCVFSPASSTSSPRATAPRSSGIRTGRFIRTATTTSWRSASC